MSTLAGLGPLLRLAWRRDRVLVPISVLAISGSAVSGAQATLALYPTSASMGEAVRAVVTNPAALALYGPVADPTSPDAFAVYKMATLGGIFLVLLGYALVRRHTRSEEDLGRLELLGQVWSGGGRRSQLRSSSPRPRSWSPVCSPLPGTSRSGWAWPARRPRSPAGPPPRWPSSASPR